MKATAFIRAAAEQPRALNVLGEEITVLASGEATGGYEVFLQRGHTGDGPPPHTHDWDETFYVIAGSVEIGAGDQSQLCQPGAIAHAPAGTPHWFRFHTDGAMVSVTSRLGASEFYADVDRATSGATSAVETTVAVALRHGMTFPEAA